VVRHGSFAFADDAQKEAARSSFLARLKSSAARRAIGAYPAAREGQRAFYLLSLRPGTDLAQLLPNVSPLQRELDVVLLHEGILEPALGITPHPSRRKRISPTNAKRQTRSLRLTPAKRRFRFCSTRADVEEVVKIATANEVMPQKSTDFFPKLLSGITMYRV